VRGVPAHRVPLCARCSDGKALEHHSMCVQPCRGTDGLRLSPLCYRKDCNKETASEQDGTACAMRGHSLGAPVQPWACLAACDRRIVLWLSAFRKLNMVGSSLTFKQ
jgi:hypothetical protein